MKQHVNSRLQILLRKEYRCSILHTHKKKNEKKRKNRRNKDKAKFSIFNQKETQQKRNIDFCFETSLNPILSLDFSDFTDILSNRSKRDTYYTMEKYDRVSNENIHR